MVEVAAIGMHGARRELDQLTGDTHLDVCDRGDFHSGRGQLSLHDGTIDGRAGRLDLAHQRLRDGDPG